MSRFRKQNEYNFWPSFVDALSNLLIVVLFFLMIFVLAHFFLGQNLNDKNSEIVFLSGRLKSLSDELSTERAASRSLSEQLEASKKEYADSLLRITALKEDIRTLEEQKASLEKGLSAEKKISSDAQARAAMLAKKTEQMTEELKKLTATLGEAEKRAAEQNAQIVDLGRRLNRALAQKTSELTAYRSEFFGTLRKIIQDRADFRIEGDRFVFQSELFFKSGSAELEKQGQKQLDLLAQALKELDRKIPKKIRWILRVDGHTDNIPIHTEKYASNWHLSSDRAVAVVQYLLGKGVPAKRLVAAGFGPNHPVAKGNSPEARKKNRRIEFKLTES